MRRLYLIAWAAIAGLAWLTHAAVSHDALLAGGVPPAAALIAFVGAWLLMTSAMMVPGSVPTIRLFSRLGGGDRVGGAAEASFLAAYFAVWTLFALLAVAGDAGIHAVVGTWGWLDDHSAVVAGAVLIAAGTFQLTRLKARYLDECRRPASFLGRHYRRGVGGACAVGLRHGLVCVGCSGALMLVMFAVGVGSVVWMLVLTAVMTIERVWHAGPRLTPVVGAALIALGLTVCALAI